MSKKPIFTTITLALNQLQMLKETVASIIAQTYPHLEMIIIGNGATEEIHEYLASLERKDSRIKLMHFRTDQLAEICFNSALSTAQGAYVFYLSEGDFISPDYAQRMIDLFEGNPECTTAAGINVSVDAKGELTPEGPRDSNFRPGYMPGHLLALETLKNERSFMFSVARAVFTVKREVMIKAGGYHPVFESSQLFGIVPFGVTGFDEKAFLYWRRYGGPSSFTLQLKGFSTVERHCGLLKEWDLHKKWEESFGKREADFFVRALIRQKIKVSADYFTQNIFTFSWPPVWFIFSKRWHSWYFWRVVPQMAWVNKWLLKLSMRKLLFKTNGVS